MGRKITQYPNNVSVTPDELSLIDVSEKTGVAVYESRKWTLTQFKAWLNANLTIPSIDGTQGQIPLFVQDDVIGSNTRFTFIDNEGTEVGFRFSDSAGNLTQAGVTYLNVESQDLASNSVLRLANWADNANKGIVSFRKSRGTKTNPTKVLNDDVIGSLIFAGQSDRIVYDGFNYTTYPSGMTTGEIIIRAIEDYVKNYNSFINQTNATGLTQFEILLQPSNGFANGDSTPSNVKVFSVDGNGKVSFKNYIFPTGDGSANQVLTTNGAGQLTWTNPSSGVNGSGTQYTLPIWSTTNQLGDSLITQNSSGTMLGINTNVFGNFALVNIVSTQQKGIHVDNTNEFGVCYSGTSTSSNGYAKGIDVSSQVSGTGAWVRGVVGSATALNYAFSIGGDFTATSNTGQGYAVGIKSQAISTDNNTRYCFWGQDGTQGINKVLTSVTSDGKAQWRDISQVTSFIPPLQGTETFRGITHRNGVVTYDTYAGYTINITGAQLAKSVSAGNIQFRQIVSSYTPTSTSVGAYGCVRGGSLLWSYGCGFYFVCEYGIADSAYAPNTHNFVGLTATTSALAIGGSGNGQPSAITSPFIAMANDSTDANMQIMYKSFSTGLTVKIDLGSNFPSNRPSGTYIPSMYKVEFYNDDSGIKYRVTYYSNIGRYVATGVITDISAYTLWTFQVGRSMGTQLGGVNGAGEFVLGRCGVYNSL